MSMDRMSMFAYLISMTSKESLDELQGNKDWKMINTERDPVKLWLMNCNQTLKTLKVASVTKRTEREEYTVFKQGIYEEMRFDARLDTLITSGNIAPAAKDVTIDFLHGLDENNYAEFKAELVNLHATKDPT
jgi:hypothetical protein